MKLLKVSFLIFLLLVLTTKGVLAMVIDGGGGGGGEGKITNWYNSVYGPDWNLESLGNETANNFYIHISDALLGAPPQVQAGRHDGGAIGDLGRLIAGMYTNPPVSSVEYFADLGRHLGLVKPAYAQGIGFEGLKPVLPLWKVFRDIAYLFFVVVFIIVGFAIMFRVKINPQTVISIENALPRIVLALILVTFSYAIAGLLVDFIYVSINLILALLSPVSGSTPIDLNQNVFALFSRLFTSWTDVATTVGSQIQELTKNLFSGLGGTVLGFTVGSLATAVIALAIAYSLFKLFFSLLMSYVSIIFAVIFSPIMLMFQALPGQNGFSNWLKTMLTNMIPFPVTAGVLAVASFLTKGAESSPGKTWVAPFLGAGTSITYIPVLIGVGMILLIPSIIDSVKKSIGAPGIAGMAGGIAGPLGVGLQVPATFVGKLEEGRKAWRAKEKAEKLVEQEKLWRERMLLKP